MEIFIKDLFKIYYSLSLSLVTSDKSNRAYVLQFLSLIIVGVNNSIHNTLLYCFFYSTPGRKSTHTWFTPRTSPETHQVSKEASLGVPWRFLRTYALEILTLLSLQTLES